jgi:hypothetical protein
MNVNIIEGTEPLSADFRAAPSAARKRSTGTPIPRIPSRRMRLPGIVAPAGGIENISGTEQLLLDPAQNDAFQLINRAPGRRRAQVAPRRRAMAASM